jgi:hypothetical protein
MSRTSWHPAFFGAIQLELDEYRDVLEFESEHQLTSEPLKLDVVIIKKRRNIVIQKNIARIFRKYNLIEYKSPSVSATIDDYAKMQGCGWLLSAFEHVDTKNMSITMVITKRPQKLLTHLKCRFGLTSTQQGIYTIENYHIPTQIIISNELSEDENLCLTSLNRNITANRLNNAATKALSHKNNAAVTAFLDVVIGANFETYKKLMETKDMKTLTQHLKEMGLVDKLIAEERAERQADKIEIARKLKGLGIDCKSIVIATGLPLKEVKRLK